MVTKPKKPSPKKRATAKKNLPSVKNNQENPPPFIITLGGSAGGIEEFQKFFSHMPADSGMAFIVISHLEPNHTSFLPDIIQKATKMPVVQIENNMPIDPNKVYIIPPNHNIAINNHLLITKKQISPHYSNAPINTFFESLAKAFHENACGIILSGAGFDGTTGIKKIKNYGGIVIAQDPTEATQEGMPLSAINTGLVDYIIPTEEMPAVLLKLYQTKKTTEKANPDHKHPDYLKIFHLLKNFTGHDFSPYKLNTLQRRIDRQMMMHNMSHVEQYIEYLEKNSHEITKLFYDLVIGVTNFFRDPEAFNVLKTNVLPGMFKRLGPNNTLRIWVPGCSTGEEAYSLAILISEHMAEFKLHNNIQIFGTDIDPKALETARSGLYPASIASDVSPHRLHKFFFKEINRYRIKPEIRQMVVFGEQSIIRDPPFTKLDMICCRNLLIYLTPNTQKKVFPLFHYSLKPKGILFLGTSETTTGSVNLFKPLDKKWKIFARNDEAISQFTLMNFPYNPKISNHILVEPKVPQKDEKEFDYYFEQILLDQFVCPCFIINKKGKIFYKHPKINYPPYKKSQEDNFFYYFPSKQKAKIKAAITRVVKLKKEIIIANTSNPNSTSYIKSINIKILPIKDLPKLKGALLVILEDIIKKGEIKSVLKKYGSVVKMSKKIHELESKLQLTHESLQMSIEELQSSNEELQSTNEELQSTNEEIDTSREELQSLNEELLIVNNQLQSRIESFTEMNNNTVNLYNSTGMAAVFLDNHLNIKHFTPNAQKFIRILDNDIGRSIKDFAINFIYENYLTDIHNVLSEDKPKIIEVLGKDEKNYLIQILPYHNAANILDGVIITFSDISEQKEHQKKLQSSNEKLQLALNFSETINRVMHEPFLVLDNAFNIVSTNDAFYDIATEKNIIGQNFFKVINKEWDTSEMHDYLNNIFNDEQKVKKVILDVTKDDKCQKLVLHTHIFMHNNLKMLLLTMEII